LRFTNYVRRGAGGDRWDVCGEYGVEFGDEGSSEGEGSDEE